MGISDIDLEDLPEGREDAFVAFVDRLTEAYRQEQRNDREWNTDHNGNYDGSYGPERSFVTHCLAFADEYGVELNVSDISGQDDNREFYRGFGRFKSEVEYVVMRFKLRTRRDGYINTGTVIVVDGDFKPAIHKNLLVVRQIVEENVSDKNKKDRIYKKIAALQSEVDRDRTSVDALFSRAIDVSQTIGEVAENIEPAIDAFERIMKSLFSGSKKQELLPRPNRPKAIEDKSDEIQASDMDDEIPF